MGHRSEVYETADRYVERAAALDPVGATEAGILGFDAEMTDYSPDAHAERAEHDRATLRALQAVDPLDDRDRVAVELVTERIQVDIDRFEAREHLRDLNVIASPAQAVRDCFELMPTDDVDDWETVVARMGMVPEALSGYQASLASGARQGIAAARRQVEAVREQVRIVVGDDGTRPYFLGLLDRFDRSGLHAPVLRATLEEHARRATEAYASFGRFLVDSYARKAAAADAVGEERYAVAARAFSGTDLDLRETYLWGWDELDRITAEMAEVAERILPGRPIGEVIELLETDPSRAIEGVDRFRAWLQDLMDRTIAELDGAHFDIPEPVKRVEAMIAPPGGAAAMYYTPPAEDFSRPGRTWYPTQGRTVFPLWGEVSTAYHEGVPGHHLQVAQVTWLAGELSRYQRTMGWVSGHGEGWALYAERLMGELGYLDDPDHELGMLRAQAFRAARVVVDIGIHLGLEIPRDRGYHPGEVWTAELAVPFMARRSHEPEAFLRSEVDRYCGWPGQAISYKVGERVWLEARDDAARRHGDAFDLKEFHRRALDLGSMGLDQLRRELARI